MKVRVTFMMENDKHDHTHKKEELEESTRLFWDLLLCKVFGDTYPETNCTVEKAEIVER